MNLRSLIVIAIAAGCSSTSSVNYADPYLTAFGEKYAIGSVGETPAAVISSLDVDDRDRSCINDSFATHPTPASIETWMSVEVVEPSVTATTPDWNPMDGIEPIGEITSPSIKSSLAAMLGCFDEDTYIATNAYMERYRTVANVSNIPAGVASDMLASNRCGNAVFYEHTTSDQRTELAAFLLDGNTRAVTDFYDTLTVRSDYADNILACLGQRLD